jgi:hypothetical protein
MSAGRSVSRSGHSQLQSAMATFGPGPGPSSSSDYTSNKAERSSGKRTSEEAFGAIDDVLFVEVESTNPTIIGTQYSSTSGMECDRYCVLQWRRYSPQLHAVV